MTSAANERPSGERRPSSSPRARGRALAALQRALVRPAHASWLAALRVLVACLVCVTVLRYVIYERIDPLFVAPRFHFKYWGFGWVEPLSPAAMHALPWVLALLALCVALGVWFRLSCGALALGFAYLQLIDVATYLNHYYLVGLLLLLLTVSPAGRFASVDAWRRPATRRDTISSVWLWLFRFQVGVVYVFAALAKAHTDWLVHAQPLRIWLANRSDLPLLGTLFGQPWAALAMSWAGFAFDAGVVWLLLIPRLRMLGYGALVAFHALTYVLFPFIGMFPVIMTLSALVFFPPAWPVVAWAWLRGRSGATPPSSGATEARAAQGQRPPARHNWTVSLAVAYCTLQLAVPLRFLAYRDGVLWHEQGMRFSWRVMVRTKGSSVTFHVRDPRSGQHWQVGAEDYLSGLQVREMGEQPDLILQFAHYLRGEFARRGFDGVEIRADALVSLNGRASRNLVDPRVDLTHVVDGWATANWILPAPTEPPPHTRALRRGTPVVSAAAPQTATHTMLGERH